MSIIKVKTENYGDLYLNTDAIFKFWAHPEDGKIYTQVKFYSTALQSGLIVQHTPEELEQMIKFAYP